MFYGCTEYPRCRGTLEFSPDDVPSPGFNKQPKRKKKRRQEAQVNPATPLDPKLNATVPPLPPDLVDEPIDSTEQDDDEDDFLFDG